MKKHKVVDFTHYRSKQRQSKPKQLKTRKKGKVYKRNGKLWVDSYYLGERVRQTSGLSDTPLNRKQVQRQINLIKAEIENRIFEFAKRFPQSRQKDYFIRFENIISGGS